MVSVLKNQKKIKKIAANQPSYKQAIERPFDLHLFIAVSRSQCFLVLVIITYLFGSTVRCKFFSIFFQFFFSVLFLNLKFRSHRYNWLLQSIKNKKQKKKKPKPKQKHKKSVGCWLHYNSMSFWHKP